MDAPTSAAPRLAAGVAQGPAPVSNEFRARIESRVRTLRGLRHPTVEQIERKLFLKEYLALKF